MIKTLKSDKGYFYKIIDDKKFRISKNEYLKLRNSNIDRYKHRHEDSKKGWDSKWINKYFKINDTVGSGNYGEIKFATIKKVPTKKFLVNKNKLNVNQKVALKCINLKNCNYNDEINTLSKVNHDNVVKLYGQNKILDQYLFLVMEYIDGKNLKELIYSDEYSDFYINKSLNDSIKNIKIKLLYQIAKGLQHMHNLDIMHRDLKPDNVMILDYNTNDNFAKIVDFGFATDKKKSKKRIGTKRYYAPELSNKVMYTKKVDVWSYGVMAHLILTGILIFKDDVLIKLKEYNNNWRFYANSDNKLQLYGNLQHPIEKLLDMTLKKEISKRIDMNKLLKLPLFKILK